MNCTMEDFFHNDGDFFDDLDDLADDTFASFGPSDVQSHLQQHVRPCPYATGISDNFASITGTKTPAMTSNRFLPVSITEKTLSIIGDGNMACSHGDVVYNNDLEYSSDDVQAVQLGQQQQHQIPLSNVSSHRLTESEECKYLHALRYLDLLDYNGCELVDERHRICNPRLLMLPRYFGLEFIDSVNGRSVVPFLPSDIVAVMRQNDRIALYIKFRRYLSCGIMEYITSEHVGNNRRDFDDEKAHERFMMDYDEEENGMDDLQEHDEAYDEIPLHPNVSKYYPDSPLSQMVNMLLYFNDHSEITRVFEYMQCNQSIMNHLKLVYPGWMFCSNTCTRNDVELIALECEDPTAYRNSSSFKNRRLRTVVNVNRTLSPSDMSTRSDRHARGDEQPSLPTPQATKILSSPGQLNSMQTQHSNISTINAAILDSNKLLEVLPSAFIAMDRVLQAFALRLMEQGRLMPFQMTIGLCKTLEIARTDASRKRAMQLLYTLSKFPNTQLTEMGNVGKWLLDADDRCSTSTVTTTETDTTREILPENDTATEKQQKQQHQGVGEIVDGEWVLIGENTTTTATTTNVPQPPPPPPQDDQRDAFSSSRQHKPKYFGLSRLLKPKKRSNANNDCTDPRKGESTCSVM